MRHAQAVAASDEAGDAARALSARGRRDAAALAALLAGDAAPDAPPIDRVACSAATRTRETLALLLPALGAAGRDATLDEGLYLASADALAERVDALFAGGARHPLLVGHNPGLERLCARLLGAPGLVMDTCARFTLRFDGPEAEPGEGPDSGPGAGPGTATRVAHDVPRG